MSSKQRSIRLNALAAATVIAISSSFATAAAADRVNIATVQSDGPNDRFIVKYREGSAERNDVGRARSALEHAGISAQRGNGLRLGHMRRLAGGADVVRAGRRLDPAEAETLMRQIAADPNVEYVEVDQLMKPLMTPNDTHYADYLWGMQDGSGGMRANQAWDSADGAGVVVAVIDTGIAAHSDLDANILSGYDFISDSSMARDGNGRDGNPNDEGDWYGANECGGSHPAADSSWHGTHVAGTVAAVGNNSKGVIGAAYNAKVVPVRVLGKCGGYTSDIVDGLTWASGGSVSGVPANANPAEVINMSLGGGGSCSSTYQNAIDAAVGRGSTVVVAAGNSNANVANFSPASCNNVVSVAANNKTGGRASYSNYGSLIDVAAPGGDSPDCTTLIVSTGNAGTTTPTDENYKCMAGTSMAAPHVAGVAALMQSVASSPLTPAEVESTLKSTLRAFPSTPDQDIGDGIVDAKAAVDAAAGGTEPPPSGNELQKGVPVTGLSASQGNWVHYTMEVPAGASDLDFSISGGSGDADLYVKYGSEPTTSSYDCRPYRSGNEETCSFASPQAGTWHVSLRAYSSFSDVSLVGDYSEGGGGGSQTYSNTADYTINDNSTVTSPISVSGRSGNAGSSVPVAVDIKHTYIGDLKVDLVAPDGSVYVLHNRSGGSADNIDKTYTVNLSPEALNGTWKLRVNDNYSQDTGYIDSWSITF